MIESINLDDWFPDPSDVEDIDAYLIKEWRIGHILDWEYQAGLIKAIGRKKWKRFEDLVSNMDEKPIADAMADFDVHAVHLSQSRRAFILDQMAVTYEWMKRTGFSGDVLDIGCHNGILLTYLAQRFPNGFHGIDPSKKSIRFAQNQHERLTNLTFEVGSIPAALDRKYDLIICNDVLHHLQDFEQLAAVSSIFASLNDGMAAIISTQTFEDQSWWEAIGPAMSEHGISLIAGGRVGGCVYGGSVPWETEWASTGLGVFQKSGKTEPVDVSALIERVNSHWTNFFQPYANDPSNLWSEKTMAYEASRRSE